MSALNSVQLAIDLATRQRDAAAQVLTQVQSAHQFAQDQMAQLETYATETETRWTVSAQAGTTPEMMQHHYQFMDRLYHAVGLQKGALENTSQRVDAARKLVLAAEFRLVSLNQVLRKQQAAIALVQSRREQKQMDEFAAMQTSKSKNGYSGENDHEH